MLVYRSGLVDPARRYLATSARPLGSMSRPQYRKSVRSPRGLIAHGWIPTSGSSTQELATALQLLKGDVRRFDAMYWHRPPCQYHNVFPLRAPPSVQRVDRVCVVFTGGRRRCRVDDRGLPVRTRSACIRPAGR